MEDRGRAWDAKEMTLEFGYVEIQSRHQVSAAEPSLKPGFLEERKLWGEN